MNNIQGFYKYLAAIISFVMMLTLSAKAQKNTCSQTLIKAQFTYYEGRAEEVPDMLEACLKDGFTTDEKLQAYRLLTLTYLYLNESSQAEKTMLAFLQLNPVYKINEAVDPAEFINLYKQFRTWALYLAGTKAGINTTYVNILQPYSLDNVYVTQAAYQPAFSYSIGTTLEVPLKDRLSASAELYLTGTRFTYSNELFDYLTHRSVETQNRLDLPLLLNYTLPGKKFNPYLGGGITSSLLLKGQAQVRRTDDIGFNEGQKETSGPNITLTSQRRMFTFSGTFNLGVKYTRSRNIFILEGRYNLGLHNVVRKSNRYSNIEPILKYGFIDNDFTLNSFTLAVGYLIPVYKPRKLTNKKNSESSLTF
jgi:hypothetical protein